MKKELPDFIEALNTLKTAVEQHRSTPPRFKAFPATIRKQAIDLLNEGCSATLIVKSCGLRFDQLNLWQKSNSKSPSRKCHEIDKSVAVKVLTVENSIDSIPKDDGLSSLSLRGVVDGVPFVLSFGHQILRRG